MADWIFTHPLQARTLGLLLVLAMFWWAGRERKVKE